MKILSTVAASSGDNVTLYADSSIVTGGRPVFLPDCDMPWRGNLALAYRVSRLGKNIGEKFAPRYVDAFTVVMMASSDAMAGGMTEITDGALALGAWVDIDNAGFSIRFGEEVFSAEHASTGIFRELARLSRNATLKNGDIIIPCLAGMSAVALDKDTRITVEIDNTKVLDYNLK